MQEGYNTFFEDCIPEFEKFGKILQFKVKFLGNWGRLAIIWSRILGGMFLFNMKMRWMLSRRCLSWKAGNFFWAKGGRYYAGVPLNISFSLIKDWKQAVCAYDGNFSLSLMERILSEVCRMQFPACLQEFERKIPHCDPQERPQGLPKWVKGIESSRQCYPR
jgi:hypothetical protein